MCLPDSGRADADELQLVLLLLLYWHAAFGAASDVHALLSLSGAAWSGAGAGVAASADPLVFSPTATWP